MKAVRSLGSGPRGRLVVIAAGAVVLMLSMVLLLSGCGDEETEGTVSSQLDGDGSAAGTSSVGDVGPAGGAAAGDENQEDVMVGLTWNDCVADMTVRYGDEEVARRVCNSIRTDYSDQPESELASILPAVEAKENVSANPGGSTPGGGSTGGGGGGTQTSPGWGEIEIVVPPAP